MEDLKGPISPPGTRLGRPLRPALELPHDLGPVDPLPGAPLPQPQPVTPAPRPGRLALLTWVGVAPVLVLVDGWLPDAWPRWLRLALATAVAVTLWTHLLLPRCSRRLHRWLHAEPGRHGGRGAIHTRRGPDALDDEPVRW